MIVEVYNENGDKIAAYPINLNGKNKKRLTSDKILQIAQSLAVQDGLCSAEDLSKLRFLMTV